MLCVAVSVHLLHNHFRGEGVHDHDDIDYIICARSHNKVVRLLIPNIQGECVQVVGSCAGPQP